MNEIGKVIVNQKEIILIDYSDCNENRMIEVLSQARKLIRVENKPQRVLAIFNQRSYLTQKVMECFNSDRLAPHLLERQAAVGVNSPKKWIIEGNNLFHNNTIRVFDSRQEAIDYLSSN